MFGFLFYLRWYFTQFHVSNRITQPGSFLFSGLFQYIRKWYYFVSKISLWEKNEILGCQQKSSRHIQPEWKLNGMSNYLQFTLSNVPCRPSSEIKHLHSSDDFFFRIGEYFWMTQCTMTTHWRAEAWEVSFWRIK